MNPSSATQAPTQSTLATATAPVASTKSTLPAPSTTSNAPKRTAADANLGSDENEEPDWETILDNTPIDMSCNSVRNKIRALIDPGECRIGQFCKEIGVSNKSYNTFMGMIV